MRAFPLSAATASDATTTSGFGSGLGSGSQSKIDVAISNSFYVVFCHIVVHKPNFIQIGQKNVKNIGFWLALVGWSGQSKNSCIRSKLILFGF